MGALDAAKVIDRALSLFPYTDRLLDRRARLTAIDADTRAALAKLQWEMDDLRGPTIEALFSFAKANRASLR